MTTQDATLIAATIAASIAAVASIINLVFNSHLTILREKRMLSWQHERIVELEEAAGKAMDLALSCVSPRR